MTRDPHPALNHSTNLRDLPLEPSNIIKARPTIIHPQLRDLILPLERGKVLYPRGNSIEELTFSHSSPDNEDEDDGEEMGMETEMDMDIDGTGRSVSQSKRDGLMVDPRFESDVI
jgi:hypothetical protein